MTLFPDVGRGGSGEARSPIVGRGKVHSRVESPGRGRGSSVHVGSITPPLTKLTLEAALELIRQLMGTPKCRTQGSGTADHDSRGC